MHLYFQLIQAETGDVIKQMLRCNQVVTGREQEEGGIKIHGDLAAATGETRVWSFCPMLW